MIHSVNKYRFLGQDARYGRAKNGPQRLDKSGARETPGGDESENLKKNYSKKALAFPELVVYTIFARYCVFRRDRPP